MLESGCGGDEEVILRAMKVKGRSLKLQFLRHVRRKFLILSAIHRLINDKRSPSNVTIILFITLHHHI